MAPRPERSYSRPEEAVVHIKVHIEKVKSLPPLPWNLSCTCDTSKLQMPAKQRANLAVKQKTTHACRGRGRATYDNLVDLAGRAGLVFGTDSGLSPVAVPLARVKRLYLRHRQSTQAHAEQSNVSIVGKVFQHCTSRPACSPASVRQKAVRSRGHSLPGTCIPTQRK
jgi:hypothetical protein